MAMFFDEATHTYYINGVSVPSVTEITRFLQYDTAQNAKPWLRDEAARRGTDIHAMTVWEDYGENPDNEIDVAYSGYIMAYRRFLADFKPEWVGIEKMVGSESLGYAGTIDRYGYIFGVPCVLDIKTGGYHKQAITAQLTGYHRLLSFECGFIPEKHYGLYLHKDGTPELKEFDADPELFNACVTINKRFYRERKLNK